MLSRPVEALPSTSGNTPGNVVEVRPSARLTRQPRDSRPCATPGAFPTLQLRGDRAYLRALRAAELTAWEAGELVITPREIPVDFADPGNA